VKAVKRLLEGHEEKPEWAPQSVEIWLYRFLLINNSEMTIDQQKKCINFN